MKWIETICNLPLECDKIKPKMGKRMKNGFTLVELSIVLVIIALVVAGVLVGQDLIASAQVRANVRQIAGFDAAATAFRARFRGIPGDINNATDYLDPSVWTVLQNGNNDKLLQDADFSSSYATSPRADEMTGE